MAVGRVKRVAGQEPLIAVRPDVDEVLWDDRKVL